MSKVFISISVWWAVLEEVCRNRIVTRMALYRKWIRIWDNVDSFSGFWEITVAELVLLAFICSSCLYAVDVIIFLGLKVSNVSYLIHIFIQVIYLSMFLQTVTTRGGPKVKKISWFWRFKVVYYGTSYLFLMWSVKWY